MWTEEHAAAIGEMASRDGRRVKFAPVRFAENVLVWEGDIHSHRLARLLSEANKGIFWANRSGGVTWCRGRHTAFLVHQSQLSAILSARECVSELGLSAGWSVGSCARALLKWLAVEAPCMMPTSRLTDGIEWGLS